MSTVDPSMYDLVKKMIIERIAHADRIISNLKQLHLQRPRHIGNIQIKEDELIEVLEGLEASLLAVESTDGSGAWQAVRHFYQKAQDFLTTSKLSY